MAKDKGKGKKGKGKDGKKDNADTPQTFDLMMYGVTVGQRDRVAELADELDITVVEGKPVATDGKTGGRPYANPHVTDDGKKLPTPNTRNVSKAAGEYGRKFGPDAKKAVLNHFGATAITGANGIDSKDLPQALEIFMGVTEFQPSLDGLDAGQTDDDDDKKSKGQKNKKNKGDDDGKDTADDNGKDGETKKERKKRLKREAAEAEQAATAAAAADTDDGKKKDKGKKGKDGKKKDKGKKGKDGKKKGKGEGEAADWPDAE